MSDPIPMLLWCPECKARHVDVDEFATKVHHTHSCQICGHTWRPAVVPTVGVQFLPGFKNEEWLVNGRKLEDREGGRSSVDQATIKQCRELLCRSGHCGDGNLPSLIKRALGESYRQGVLEADNDLKKCNHTLRQLWKLFPDQEGDIVDIVREWISQKYTSPGTYFLVEKEEWERAVTWMNEIDRDDKDRSATGGRFTWMFTRTSVGTMVSIEDSISKKKIDLTDYNSL